MENIERPHIYSEDYVRADGYHFGWQIPRNCTTLAASEMIVTGVGAYLISIGEENNTQLRAAFEDGAIIARKRALGDLL